MENSPIDPAKLAGLNDVDFRAPDLVGAVEGWRVWSVKSELPPYGASPKLESVTHTYFWSPRVKARAECDKCGHETPGENCACGFYSAKNLDHLRSMSYHRYDGEFGTTAVVGRLACWGKVIEGTQGWRSEFAYPVELFVPFESHKIAKAIGETYGVPVRLLNLFNDGAYPEGYEPVNQEAK
ncbi:hypothetical protein UFOVP1313_26 [uncultured Caudovirales phage]|uniref:Uncharacterized protein n=1 Tax=uncultured Caudovirales phage TaxID=2100421 RepID=A0A6J5RL70_9CAUD|nr:hypothetical protein UFOVP1313_26 [uncultured Caudovirales phage]